MHFKTLFACSTSLLEREESPHICGCGVGRVYEVIESYPTCTVYYVALISCRAPYESYLFPFPLLSSPPLPSPPLPSPPLPSPPLPSPSPLPLPDNDDEEEDPDTEEYNERLAELEGEEPPEEEEEEEEEEENDAHERMKTAITEGFEDQNEAITLVQVCRSTLYMRNVCVCGGVGCA